jgi:hypothetical protein
MRRLALAAIVLSAGCGSPPGHVLDPATVVVAPAVWPTPQTLSPNAPPRIIAVWMNDTNIRPGKRWIGTIVTSTNVASVEVRTESFSFTADRQRFGVFGFSQDILDVIPQYRRSYVLHLVARNTGGDATERLVPVTIH